MKGLLHSKKFRKNLYKWLFMYVGVMCIFTSVITYSKYISKLQGKDTARAAKFEIGINYLNDCQNITESNACNTEGYRTTSEIEYNFAVDTSNLEVTSDFILTVHVNKDFKVKELKNVTANKIISVTPNQAGTFSLTDTIREGKTSEGYQNTTYKLTLEYIGDINASQSYNNVVTVDYSLEQVK